MNFYEIISRFFGKDNVASKSIAKERLRLVLVHDRLDVSDNIMEALKVELIAVINKYMEIDNDALEVSLSTEDNSVALVANIPVLNVRRESESKQNKLSSGAVKKEPNKKMAPACKVDPLKKEKRKNKQ